MDGGNFLGVVLYLSVPDPGHFKMIGDFASIGLAFGAALGMAKARPENGLRSSMSAMRAVACGRRAVLASKLALASVK